MKAFFCYLHFTYAKVFKFNTIQKSFVPRLHSNYDARVHSISNFTKIWI